MFIVFFMVLMFIFLVFSLIGMWVIFMWKYVVVCWLYNLRIIVRCIKKLVIVVVGKFLKKKCWCVRIWFWSLLVFKSVKWIGINIFILREIWICIVYMYVYISYVLWVGIVINNNEIVLKKNMYMYLCFYSILY